jgi:DNA-directed RNA polymerase subunit RPC12/RpoP
MSQSDSVATASQDHGTAGRYLRCATCGGRVHFKPLQVWRHTIHGEDGRLRILYCDVDGAIVEQIGREYDGRFGISYSDLVAAYKAEP